MTTVTPLHVGTVNGHPVRFFRAPSGVPEIPWHAAEDLFSAVDLPPDRRQQLTQAMRSVVGSQSATVATSEGPVVIASHLLAQAFLIGMAQAAAEAGDTFPPLDREYAEDAAEAMKILASDLPQEDQIPFLEKCFRNTQAGLDGGSDDNKEES